MGLFPSRTIRNTATGMEPQSFWQRIAQALDRFMAERSQRAVPAPVLRRSRDDIRRCHRLISQASSDATLCRRVNSANPS